VALFFCNEKLLRCKINGTKSIPVKLLGDQKNTNEIAEELYEKREFD
jgi:hypothetical protein